MCAWSAKPVSTAILQRQSEPLVMRNQAARARNSARKTDGAMLYAAANPRDTVSRASPFLSAQAPISVEVFFANSASNKSGQSFFSPGEGEEFSRRALFSR